MEEVEAEEGVSEVGLVNPLGLLEGQPVSSAEVGQNSFIGPASEGLHHPSAYVGRNVLVGVLLPGPLRSPNLFRGEGLLLCSREARQ